MDTTTVEPPLSDRPHLADVVATLQASAQPGPSRAHASLRDHALRVLGPGPVEWTVTAARDATALVAGLGREDPQLPLESVGSANETILLEFLLELVGSPPLGSTLGPIRQELVRDTAVRDVPILNVVRSVRAVQRFWTGLLLDHAAAVGARPGDLGAIAGKLAGRIDRSVDGLLNDHLIERERVLAGLAERRRGVVRALVEGRHVDRGLVRDRLALDIEHHHVAFVIVTTTHGDVVGDDRDRIAERAFRLLSAHTVVRHEADDDTLWTWASSPEPAAVDRLRSLRLGDGGTRIGVGSAHAGPDGFRRSHLEAVDAARMVCTSGRGPVVLHADVALAALLGQDRERALWFAEARLGPLAGDDGQAAELRATLRSYYRSSMRLATAAAQMHVHRNTFLLRLRRVEALLGHPVTERAADLQCALLVMDELDVEEGRPHIRPY